MLTCRRPAITLVISLLCCSRPDYQMSHALRRSSCRWPSHQPSAERALQHAVEGYRAMTNGAIRAWGEQIGRVNAQSETSKAGAHR